MLICAMEDKCFQVIFQSFKGDKYLQEKNVKMSDETRERPLNGEGLGQLSPVV